MEYPLFQIKIHLKYDIIPKFDLNDESTIILYLKSLIIQKLVFIANITSNRNLVIETLLPRILLNYFSSGQYLLFQLLYHQTIVFTVCPLKISLHISFIMPTVLNLESGNVPAEERKEDSPRVVPPVKSSFRLENSFLNVSGLFNQSNPSPAETGTIRLDQLPQSLRSMAAQFDKDGDGEISASELTLVLNEHANDLKLQKFLKIATATLIAIMAVVIVTLSLTMMTLIDKAKDTQVGSSAVLTTRNSVPVQCASTDFLVQNGTLVSRVQEASSIANSILDFRTSGAGTANAASRSLASALQVSNYYHQVHLASTLPEEYFQELEWLQLKSSTG